MLRATLVSIGVCVGGAAWGQVGVDGVVFADADGDGDQDVGEDGLAGVRVLWETSVVAVSDDGGRFHLDAPAPGIVWARPPDGFAPGPVWREVTASGEVALGLRPHETPSPFRFVDAADIHVGNVDGARAAEALAQALDLEPAPGFLTITGDIATTSSFPEYDAFAQAMAGTDVPFVPVSGNHDWDDGGIEYRSRFGPPTYSFDMGGVRFVVLSYAAPAEETFAFLAADLADAGDRMVVAFMHAPPEPPYGQALADLGIDWVFTGHAHANFIERFGALTEVNTETLGMGGIDFTPAGYRVAWVGRRTIGLSHHTVVREPVAELLSPRGRVDAGSVRVVAAVEIGAESPSVLLRIDDEIPVALQPLGGWSYAADVTLPPGRHVLELTATGGRGAVVKRTEVTAVRLEPRFPVVHDWPQLQGGADKQGRAEVETRLPLEVAWTTPVGGHLIGGSVIVYGGRVIAPVVDLTDETQGGVVALDAVRGDLVWEDRVGAAVRGAPAAAEDVVVYATADGVVHGLDAVTGHAIWTRDLGTPGAPILSWIYASPAIQDGTVYVGTQRTFAALDLHTGEPRWLIDSGQTTWGVSLAGAALAGETGVTVMGRGAGGTFAFDMAGQVKWRLPDELSLAVNATPIIGDGTAYFVNVRSDVTAVDVATGSIVWQRQLYDEGIDWSLNPTGTPALADGRLFVPTPFDSVYVLDAGTGELLWDAGAGEGIIAAGPYGVDARGYFGAVAVSGDRLFAGGVDGVVRALSVTDGGEEWSHDLGMPIVGGVVPAGDALYVGTYDGTVWAFLPPIEGEGTGCGCGVGGRGAGGGLGVLVLLALVKMLPRRRRPV